MVLKAKKRRERRKLSIKPITPLVDSFCFKMDYYKLKVLNHKRKFIIGLIIILVIALFLVYYFYYYDKEDINIVKDDNISKEITNNTNNQMISVDIKGYVEKPGVYSFSIGDDIRINDVILKSGGLKKDADTSMINLSKKIEDEMTIIIYSKSEVNDLINGKNELEEKLAICEKKLKNNACVEKKGTQSLMNINSATKEELMTLPGIGEAKAESIIKYRENTPFNAISEIKNVEGIGESLFESIKDNITV